MKEVDWRTIYAHIVWIVVVIVIVGGFISVVVKAVQHDTKMPCQAGLVLTNERVDLANERLDAQLRILHGLKERLDKLEQDGRNTHAE